MRIFAVLFYLGLAGHVSAEELPGGSPLVTPLPSSVPAAASTAVRNAPGAVNPAPGPARGSNSPSSAAALPLSTGAGAEQKRGHENPPVHGKAIDTLEPVPQETSVEIDKWIAEVLSKVTEKPRRIAFVSDLPLKGIPQFLKIDAVRFNQMGYFQVADVASRAWDMKLNKKSFGKGDSFDLAVSLTKADIIIHASKNRDWTVYSAGEGRRVVLAKAPPPATTTEEDLSSWLITVLGWDGIVLDKRGQQVLVGSTSLILALPQLQALAVGGSATRPLLLQNERNGSGLLSLVYAKNGIGVFDIVFLGQGVKDIPVGTKLVIEKR